MAVEVMNDPESLESPRTIHVTSEPVGDLKFAVGQRVRVIGLLGFEPEGEITGTFPIAAPSMLDDVPPVHYYRVALPEPWSGMEFREDDLEVVEVS